MRAASVGLSELETVASGLLSADDRAKLIRREPVHPFSEELFLGTPPHATVTRSTSEQWAVAARNLRTMDRSSWVFASGGVAAEPIPDLVNLEDLARCIEDPTRYFCERVLGLQLREEDGLPRHEPLGADGKAWSQRKLSYRLEAAQRRGDTRSREAVEAWIRAQPELPLGADGEDEAQLLLDFLGWWDEIEAMRQIAWIPPQKIRIPCGRWLIEGRLDQLTPHGRCITGFFPIREYSAVQHWVRHLALCAYGAERLGVEPSTHFLTPEPWSFEAMEAQDAEALLLELCELFAEAHERPIPLFRKAGISLLCAKSHASAVRAAQSAWEGGPRSSGEKDEPAHQLCWPDRNFYLDDAFFEEVAMRADAVLRPLLFARPKDDNDAREVPA
jgi:exonuclease V gamma subunit